MTGQRVVISRAESTFDVVNEREPAKVHISFPREGETLSSSQQARMLANREAALARLRAGQSRSRPSSPAALEPQRQPSAQNAAQRSS